MATGNSTIVVKIIGDAKAFGKTLDQTDKSLGGWGKKIAGGVAVAFAADAVLDFSQTALAESDRIGDAMTRLETQIGTELTGALDDASGKLEHLGLSRQDVLELEAAFADMGTAIGLADDGIAKFAGPAAETAAAIALITDQDAATVIDLIGKAAGGSEKALRALGINLSDAEVEARAMRDTGKDIPEQLTDSEKAAAAYSLVLEKLAPRLTAVSEGSGDVEQSQAELQARFETLTGKVGEGLEGPLNDFLGWILSGIDGLEMLADRIGPFIDGLGDMADEAHDALGPLGGLTDALGNILGLIGDISRFDLAALFRRINGAINGYVPPAGLGRGSDDVLPTAGSGSRAGAFAPVTINVPATGAQTEAAVVKAIRDYEARNGPLR